jgi:hypothetical protein
MDELTIKQKLYFEKIYAHLYSKGQPTPDNRIQVSTVINFMRSSGLPDTKLKEVWRLSSNGVNEPISKPQLFNILRYITLAQNSYEVRQNLLNTSSQLGLPEFSELSFTPNDFDRPEHPAPTSNPNADNYEQSLQMMVSNLQAYKTQIASLLQSPPPFTVTNKNAFEFFSNFNMQTKDLSNVWNLCDTNSKGFMSEPEIIVALHLIRMFKMGRPLPLPLPRNFQQFIETYNSQQSNAHAPVHRSSTFGNLGGQRKLEGQISNSDITSPRTEVDPNVFASKTVQNAFPVIDPSPNNHHNNRPKIPQQAQNMRSSNFFVNFPEPEKEQHSQQNNQKRSTHNSITNSLSENAKPKLRTPNADTRSEVDSISSPNLPRKPQSDENGHESIKLLNALLSQIDGLNNQTQTSNEQFYLQLSGLTTQKDDLILRVNQNMSDFFTLFNQLVQKVANLKSSLANLQINSETQVQILKLVREFEIPDSVQGTVESLLESSQAHLTGLKKLTPGDHTATPTETQTESRQSHEPTNDKPVPEQPQNNNPVHESEPEAPFQKQEDKQPHADAPNFEAQDQPAKENLFDPNFDFDTFGGNEKEDVKMFSDFGFEADFKNPFSEDVTHKKQFDDDFNF